MLRPPNLIEQLRNDQHACIDRHYWKEVTKKSTTQRPAAASRLHAESSSDEKRNNYWGMTGTAAISTERTAAVQCPGGQEHSWGAQRNVCGKRSHKTTGLQKERKKVPITNTRSSSSSSSDKSSKYDDAIQPTAATTKVPPLRFFRVRQKYSWRGKAMTNILDPRRV